jgi:hypothetical protein
MWLEKQIPSLRCGMTARKAEAKTTAKEEADPCGMTARKTRTTATTEQVQRLLLEKGF